MWKRQQGRDDRGGYSERDREPHFDSRDDGYNEVDYNHGESRYSHPDELGRSDGYEDQRRVVQHQVDEYDSYGARDEYDPRYDSERRMEENRDGRFDNTGKMETYPDDGYDQKRDFPDSRYEDGGRRDGYEGDRFDDSGRGEWDGNRYDDVYGEGGTIPDARGRGDVSGDWNRDNQLGYDRYDTADDRSLNKTYEYSTQQTGRFEDRGERENIERAANFGRNDRGPVRRDDGRKTESENRAHNAVDRRQAPHGNERRGTATSVKDRLGNRNKNEPNRQRQANRGIGNRSEKDFSRQGHANRGSVHAKSDNKSSIGSNHVAPKVDSRQKEKDTNRSQKSKSDSKQPSKPSSGKSTSAGRRDSSGKGRTTDTTHKEKPRSRSSSRKSDPKQGSSRSSSTKQSKPESKERTTNVQHSSKSDKKHDDKQKIRSPRDGHQSSRQTSQTEKGLKRDKDRSDSQGASRHVAERRNPFNSHRSGGSDSKHDKSSFSEMGTFHEDDVISILVEDDAFARESNRLERGDRTAFDANFDAPFQIHAESSASIFDDETSTSNRHTDKFKVPSKVPSKDSSNKTRQTSLRDRMSQKKNPAYSKVNSWKQKPNTKPQIKSFSSSRNRFGNSSRNYGNTGNKQKNVMRHKFSKNNKTRSQGAQGHQAVERSGESRMEMGRTGAILKEDVNITRNDSIHGQARHDNRMSTDDYYQFSNEDPSAGPGHTRHDNRMSEDNYYQFSNEESAAGPGHTRHDNRISEDNYYENPAADPNHVAPNEWSREMGRTDRNERDHRHSRERYNEFPRNEENNRNFNGSKISGNQSRSRYNRRNQQADDGRRSENYSRNQSGARSNNWKSRGIYQSEKVKKKYRSSGFSKGYEASSGKSKTVSGRGKDSRSKTESRSSRNKHSSKRDDKIVTQENIQQSGIMPTSNLPMPGVDANQQLIFVPNPDMQANQPQFIDQFGNVILNPDVGLQHGAAQPMPIQLAQPGIPPEAPPGSEQIIFIPFNQMQGYPENVVPVVGSGQHIVSGIQSIDADKQARLEKSVRPGQKPLTREQRAKLRSRLLIKRRARLEKEVEKKLLKKLFDESKAGKDAHSSAVRQKPLITKISPPKSAGAPLRRSLKSVRKGLEDVSDDETKYEKVSDYEDLTDDESLHGGNETFKDKRHAFRKPGQPRFGVGANQNVLKGESTHHVGRSGKMETDVRKVIDRSGNSHRSSNEDPREYSPGRKRQRNVIYEEDNPDLMRPRTANRAEGNQSSAGEKATRRQRVYEKRPISPLEITVNNDHFSKETEPSSRQSPYSDDNSPRYDRRTNERVMPKENTYDDRNERSTSDQYSRRENEMEDFGNGNRKYSARGSQGESRGKYTEHEENSSRNSRDTGKYGSRYDDRRNKEDYEERNRSNDQRATERDDRNRLERGNGQASQNKRGYEEDYGGRSQDKRARPYNTSRSGSNEKFQRNRREEFESDDAIRQEDSSGNFKSSQGKSQSDQQLPPAQIVHQGGVRTSQPISFQQPASQLKMQVVGTGTQFGVDHSQPPVQHGQIDVPTFPSPIVVGPDRSLPPPQGTLIHAQTSMPIILQSQPTAIQGQPQFQSQPIQQQGQILQTSSQQSMQPQSLQQQPFQQQQQMTISNPAAGQAVFQTGIQQMHEQQPVFHTGMQSVQAPQKGMQTVQLFTGPQQHGHMQQQPQQSVSGTFVQSSNFQTPGQFQDPQQGNVSRASLNDRLPFSSGAQNVGIPQSRQQSLFVPTTPQQAVRGAIMNVNTNVGVRAAGPTRNRMPLRQGGGSLALSAGAVRLGTSAPTRTYYKGAGNMPGTVPTSTVSRAPGRFEANMNANMGMEEMADMGEAEFEQDDDLGELLCTKCDKVFLSDRVMRSHNLWHDHVESGYADTRCDICEQSFLSSGAFNTHIAEKHSVNSWNCIKCDITFANSAALARHTKIQHFRNSVQTFTCSLCGATFEAMKLLLQHKRVLHGELSSFSGTGYTRRYR